MSALWFETSTATVSAGSAIVAGVQAWRANRSQREVQRLRFLEDRVSAHKHDTYEPAIESFGLMADGKPPTNMVDDIKKFSRWISIYGSDDAVVAFRNMMATNYLVSEEHGTSRVPGAILFRMYMEFVLAARRDMGDPETKVLPLDLLSPTIKDAYETRTIWEDLSMPIEAVFAKYDWKPPWRRTVDELIDDTEIFAQMNQRPLTPTASIVEPVESAPSPSGVAVSLPRPSKNRSNRPRS